MRLHRARLTTTTAIAACLLPLAAFSALAQERALAIEVGPATDSFAPSRIGLRVSGPTSEPASSFVRGCRGQVMAEADGVAFEVTAPMTTLAFSAAGEGLASMVVGTADGLYRCALADDQGYVSNSLGEVQPGRYMVWLGTEEGGTVDARLFASERAVSAIELFGFDVSRLGEPRNGRFVYQASSESGRQTLLTGAPLYAETPINPLSPDSCWGYGRLDAADAVLSVEEAGQTLSIFAMSPRDLVMAVIDPSGPVHCNDDVYQLNPAITLPNAEPGDYQIIVGGYSSGGGDSYDLYASAGAPAFVETQVDAEAEPRAGRATIDAASGAGGLRLTSAPLSGGTDPLEGLSTEAFCAGYSDLSAPDMVVTLDAAQPLLSLYARAETDLTLAIRAPDGSWSCNDDSFQLNPGISFNNAQAGDYAVFVGSYMSGEQGEYNLYASLGQPNWEGTEPAGGFSAPDWLNDAAEPSVATLTYGPETLIDPRVIFDIAPSQTDSFGMADGCAGFLTPTQPDLVVEAEEGLPQLMVYMVSDSDGTLTVVGPDGQLYCNDDFEQLNPGVMIPNPQPGPYAIFAGTYGGNGGMATMGVTVASPQWVMDREH